MVSVKDAVCHETFFPVSKDCGTLLDASAELATIHKKLLKESIYVEGDEDIRGWYTEYSIHHDSKTYQQDGQDAKYCYFWDDRDGEDMSGWWIADEIGADMYLAFNGDAHAPNPARCRISQWEGERSVRAVHYFPSEDAIVEYREGYLRVEVQHALGLQRVKHVVDWHLAHLENAVSRRATIPARFPRMPTAGVKQILAPRRNLTSTQRPALQGYGNDPFSQQKGKCMPVARAGFSRFSAPQRCLQEAEQETQQEAEEDFTLCVSNLPRATTDAEARDIENNFRKLLISNNLAPLLTFKIEDSVVLLKFSNYRLNITALRVLHGKFLLGRKLCTQYIEKEPDQTPHEVHSIYRDSARFKSKMCGYVHRGRQCPRGPGCMYAHTAAQLARSTATQEDTRQYRVLLFNLPPMVTQSHATILEFLRNLSLDYGLLKFQVDIISIALRLWYDSAKNVLHALKGIGRMRNLCSLPAMGIQWMDPEGYDKAYEGPPNEIYMYYGDKWNPEVSEVQLECWMHKFKECHRPQCPFLHGERKEGYERQAEIEEDNPNEVVSVKNWWGAQDGEFGPMLSVSNLSCKETLTAPIIKDLFEPFGDIIDVYLVKNSDGKNSGVAFVEFRAVEACAQALKRMNGYVWQDEPIYCEYRHPPGAGALVYPDPILWAYAAPTRRKTKICSFSEFNRNCPNYHRCPFAHAKSERVVPQLEVVIDVSNIPASMSKESVEKQLWKHANIDWRREVNGDTTGGRALFSALDAALGSLDLVAGLTLTGEEVEHASLSAEFSRETRASPKVIDFYQRDRFSKTRLCDFLIEACPLKDDCPFAHHKDEVYPCTAINSGVTPWRSSSGDAVKVPLVHSFSHSMPLIPMPASALFPPFLPLDLPFSTCTAIWKPPGCPSDAVTASSQTSAPEPNVLPRAEEEVIDFSKMNEEKGLDWIEESAPLEWEETDIAALEKKKAKLKAKKDTLGICGFPLQWDVSTARKLLESIGDLFDVWIKEPGYIEVEIAREDRDAWVADIEALLVDGKQIRLLEEKPITLKRQRAGADTPAKRRKEAYTDFV